MMTESPPELRSIKDALASIMNREINVLRELLSSLREEQQILVNDQAVQIKSLLEGRQPLLESMAELRDLRIESIRELYIAAGSELDPNQDIDEKECLEILAQFASAESAELLTMRDQIIALLDELKAQTTRNQYLLENKLTTTKDFLSRLNPTDGNTTYGGDGSLAKQKPKTKVTIINHEV